MPSVLTVSLVHAARLPCLPHAARIDPFFTSVVPEFHMRKTPSLLFSLWFMFIWHFLDLHCLCFSVLWLKRNFIVPFLWSLINWEVSSQRCSREEMQGWQSNDSSLLAGTFHHAYLINDSTSPYCPEGELLTTQQLFSLALRSRPLCGHRQCCDYEELPRDIWVRCELEE